MYLGQIDQSLVNFTNKFNFSSPVGTLGIEEEIFLIDEKDDLVPLALDVLIAIAKEKNLYFKNISREGLITEKGEEILEDIKDTIGIQAELPAQQLEIISGIHRNPSSLLKELAIKRKFLNEICKNLKLKLSFESAPLIKENDIKIFPKKRYIDIRDNVGKEKIANGFIAGLHVHYGIKTTEQAIKALNHINKNIDKFSFSYTEKRMKKYVKMIGGKDKLKAPLINSWKHYFEIMRKQGFEKSPRDCWWLVRLNPIGTIELRISDVWEDFDMINKVISKFSSLIEEVL